MRASVLILMQFAGNCDQLLSALSLRIGLPPLTLAAPPPHTVARTLKLGDGHCLIKFRDRAENLPDQL